MGGVIGCGLHGDADVPASPKSGLSPQSPAYDLFLTHAWGKNNKNHKRVARVNAALKKLGFTTWFDDDRMVGQIRQQMCTGIGNSRAVLVFITADYMEKVNSEQDNNCQLEFNYAVDKKKSKLMIPIVMEKDFLDPEKWDGPLKMCLGTKMFYAMAQDSDMDSMLSGLLKELAGIGITPSQSGQAPASPTQQAKVVDVAQETKLPSQSGQAPASPTQQAKVVDVAQETKLPSQSGQAPASPTQQAKVVDVAQETKLPSQSGQAPASPTQQAKVVDVAQETKLPSQSGQAPASPTQQAKVVDVAQETKLPSQSGQAPASPTQQAKVVDVAQETKLPSQSGQAPASPTQQAKVVDVAQETKLKVEQPAGDITAEVRLAKEEKAGNVARSLPPPTMPKAPQQAAVTAPQSVTVTTARTENKKERPASIYYELSGHQLHRYATEVSTE
eukprot:jgi/Mesvir1/17576/Mv08812-RA.5